PRWACPRCGAPHRCAHGVGGWRSGGHCRPRCPRVWPPPPAGSPISPSDTPPQERFVPLKNSPQRRRTTLNVEPLEDRSLPAVAAGLSGSALFVQGTPANDLIVVRQNGDQLSVDGTSIAVSTADVNTI